MEKNTYLTAWNVAKQNMKQHACHNTDRDKLYMCISYSLGCSHF